MLFWRRRPETVRAGILRAMVGDKSMTSSESFQARLLQAERWRLGLMAGCMFALVVMWIVRRLMGGVVASVNELFAQVLSILGVGILLTGVAFWDVARRAKAGLA